MILRTLYEYALDICKLGLLTIGIFNMGSGDRKKPFVICSVISAAVIITAGTAGVPDTVITNAETILTLLTIMITIGSLIGIAVSFFSFIFITAIDSLAGGIVCLCLGLDVNGLLNDAVLRGMTNSLSMILLMIIFLIMRKRKTRRHTWRREDWKVALFATTGILGAMTYIVSVQLYALDSECFDTRVGGTTSITICGAVLLIIYIAVMVMYFTNKQNREDIQVSGQLLEAQKQYYTALLDREETTRKFRHDIRSHINCMRKLYDCGRIEELGKYLSEITFQTEGLGKTLESGNDILNIVIGDIMNEYAVSGVRFDYTGVFPEKTVMQEVDICILFSNLLKNAYEAEIKWMRSRHTENGEILMECKNLNDASFIRIQNHVSERPDIQSGIIISQKHSDGHGYGTRNIKDVVDKYDGDLKYSQEEDQFITEIVFTGIT